MRSRIYKTASENEYISFIYVSTLVKHFHLHYHIVANIPADCTFLFCSHGLEEKNGMRYWQQNRCDQLISTMNVLMMFLAVVLKMSHRFFLFILRSSFYQSFKLSSCFLFILSLKIVQHSMFDDETRLQFSHNTIHT